MKKLRAKGSELLGNQQADVMWSSSKTAVANALVLAGGHRLDGHTRLGTNGKDRSVAALRN